MKPLHYEAVCKMLLERFGAPIVGDRQGVPTSSRKKTMGNRGFGARLECGMNQATAIEGDGYMDEADLDEVTPPGEEKLVRSLKKKKGVKNPWALAWSIHNKKHEGAIHETRDRVSPQEVEAAFEDLYVELGEVQFDDLVSWLGTDKRAVFAVLPKTFLTVDINGRVVEKGLTPPQAMKAVR